MIRSSKAIAAAALLFVMPTVASALGISIVNVSSTGASSTYLRAGDEITFDLRLENATNVGIAGLDVVVSGFDTAGTNPGISSNLQLVGGAVSSSAFNLPPVFPDPADGGLSNTRTAPVNVWALSLTNPQPVRTSLFAGINTVNSTGNGLDDPSADGIGSTATGIHFRVTYRLVIAGNRGPDQNLTLNFGTNAPNGEIAIDRFGNEIPFQNASYALTVIPEPGTALLMGLGLAALATRRR